MTLDDLPPLEEVFRSAVRLKLQDDADHFETPDGLVYNGPADFVLKHGRWYRPRLAPRLTPNHCFGNSLYLAAVHGLTYVEGYVLSPNGGDLIHHAWAAKGRQAIETTWGLPGLAYIGVPFRWERADDCTWEGDANILDDFHRGYPLLRQRWRGEDWDGPWPDNERVAMLRAARDGTTTAEDLVVLARLEREIAERG